MGEIGRGDQVMEEEIKRVSEKVREVLRERGGEDIEGRRVRGWWDEECRKSKWEVTWELRRWRRRGGSREEYREKRPWYKELCEKKGRRMRDG